MLIWFGVKPATKALLALPAPSAQEAAAPGLIEAAPATGDAQANFLIEDKDERDEFLEALAARKDKSPQRHLQKLVDYDEEHAAAILKQWIRQGAAT